MIITFFLSLMFFWLGWYLRDIRNKLKALHDDLGERNYKTKAGVVRPTVKTNEQPQQDDSDTGGVRPPNPRYYAAQQVLEDEKKISRM